MVRNEDSCENTESYLKTRGDLRTGPQRIAGETYL